MTSSLEELFGSARGTASRLEYFGLHLRRGDLVEKYPAGCADVESVLWHVVHQKRQSYCPSVQNVFVMSDESSETYLAKLRQGLAAFFGGAVRLETVRARCPAPLTLPTLKHHTARLLCIGHSKPPARSQR